MIQKVLDVLMKHSLMQSVFPDESVPSNAHGRCLASSGNYSSDDIPDMSSLLPPEITRYH